MVNKKLPSNNYIHPTGLWGLLAVAWHGTGRLTMLCWGFCLAGDLLRLCWWQ